MSVLETPLSESGWNEAIFNWFFGAHLSGRPAYLSVDDVALKLIASESGSPLEDAIGALRAKLLPYLDHARPFDYWDAVAERWEKRGCDGTPPFIHVLAMTVLPFTERRATGTAAGYYRPLFELIGITDTEVRREDYRYHVPRLWGRLARWLNANEGRFGLPTARPGSHATAYLGFSRSQAVVRSADRAAFIDFFEQAGYQPGEIVSSDLLLARFEQWAMTARLSGRLRHALTDHDQRLTLGAIILHDLETWTGESRNENFKRVLRIVPRLNAARRTTTTVLRCPPGFQDLIDGDRIVAKAADERTFVDLQITWLAEFRRENFEIAGEVLQFRHAVVHAFEEDPILGGYTAVDRLTLGRTGWLALAEGAIAAQRYLADKGFDCERWASLPGWSIYRNVRLDSHDALMPEALRDVAPPSGLRAELRGGLALGNRRYSVAGAPDLLVPECPVQLEVRVDGLRIADVAPDVETRIALSGHSFEPGSHTVEVGDQKLRFELEGVRQLSGLETTLCHVLLEDPPTMLDLCPWSEALPEDVVVQGALVRRPGASLREVEPSLSPSTDGWVLFGREGEATPLPSEPDWLSLLGQHPCFFAWDDMEATVGHAVEWVARVMARRVHIRRRVQPGEPETQVEAMSSFGERSVLVSGSDAKEWSNFVTGIEPFSVPSFAKSRARYETTVAGPNEKPTALERVLHWCSERVSGSLDSYVETFQWIEGKWGDPTSAYRALRSLNRLGHLEVDWHKRRWSICPPAFVAPFNAGGLAFLVGQRFHDDLERIEKAIDTGDIDAVVVLGEARTGAPRPLLIRAGSRAELQRLAEAVGLPLVVDAAGELARMLPTLDRMVKRGYINGGFERRKISIAAGRPVFTPVLDDSWNGSYEHDAFGPMVYSVSEAAVEETRYLVDRSTAIWYALRRAGSYPVQHDPAGQTFTVSSSLGLPLLHERALIFSSGQLPSLIKRDGQWLYVYANVRPALAALVQEALTK